MCLMLWVAAEHPIPLVALENPQTPDPVNGYHHIDDVAPDAPVRARVTLPHVRYVGSHEGCGCGYNSGGLACEGLARVTEVTPMLDAMTDDERAAFAADQRSRERLRAIVEGALGHGAVEVFACWDGDEVEVTAAVTEVAPSYFTEFTSPIEERVRYRVVQGCDIVV